MHIAQSWRLKGQRYALKGAKCENCQQVTFPPREVCPHCQAINSKNYEHEQPLVLSELNTLPRAAR